jgi:hypothetical protein
MHRKASGEVEQRHEGEEFLYGESMEVSNILSYLEPTPHMKCYRLPLPVTIVCICQLPPKARP